MRHTMLLVAVIVLCALGPPSWAYYNPFEGYGGKSVSLHLSNFDVGTLYFNLPDRPAGNPYSETELHQLPTLAAYDPAYDPDNDGDYDPYRILPTGAATGEDTWGIFRVDHIKSEGQSIWTTLADDDWEITAIFWGEHDQGLVQETNSFGQVTQTIWGDNMHAAFFANQVTVGIDDYATVWTNGPTNSASVRPNGDPVYIGITDSQTSGGGFTNASAIPLWTFDTVYGANTYISDPKAEFINTFYPASPPGDISGHGVAYAVTSTVPYWGTGVANNVWQSNPSGDPVNPHAITLDFSADNAFRDWGGPSNSNGWLVCSSDPLEGAITPELSSASLMLIGLFPLGLVAWKRRKQ